MTKTIKQNATKQTSEKKQKINSNTVGLFIKNDMTVKNVKNFELHRCWCHQLVTDVGLGDGCWRQFVLRTSLKCW